MEMRQEVTKCSPIRIATDQADCLAFKCNHIVKSNHVAFGKDTIGFFRLHPLTMHPVWQ